MGIVHIVVRDMNKLIKIPFTNHIFYLLILVLFVGCSSGDKEIVDKKVTISIAAPKMELNIDESELIQVKSTPNTVDIEKLVICKSTNNDTLTVEGISLKAIRSGRVSITCRYKEVDSNIIEITVKEAIVKEVVKPVIKNISLVSISNQVIAGSNANIKIKGLQKKIYSISVYYSSGESEANGLEDKISDADGYVSWTWKVGAKTAIGEYKIFVSGEGERFETSFSVK